MSKRILILLFIFLAMALEPYTVFANGGDQRVIGQDFLINLARAPFTPVAGTKTAMTVSFVDLKTGRLIQDDLLVTVRVGKGRGSTTFIHEEKDIPIKGGVLDWSYTFENSGIHELFFDFAFASAPNERFEPPDFLLDIQPVPAKSNVLFFSILASVLTFGLGFLLGRKQGFKI